MKYDTVCMDDACFTTRSSFFTFDPQSVHIKNNHKVKSIHPLTFISCFQKDQVILQKSPFDPKFLYTQLIKTIDQSFEIVVSAVKTAFYDDIIPVFEQSISLSENIDIKNLTFLLSQGNYTILEYFQYFEGQNTQKNFASFLNQIITNIFQEMKMYVLTSKTNILRKCQKFKRSKKNYIQQQNNINKFQPKQEFIFSKKSSSHLGALQELENHQQIQKIHSMVKQQFIPSYFVRSAFSEEPEIQVIAPEEEDDSDGQEQVLGKSKTVEGQEKKPKRKRRAYKIQDEFDVVSQQEIIVKQCRNNSRTLKYLTDTYPAITKIHIFTQKLANKISFRSLIKNFPRLQKITLNCYFQLQPDVFIDQLPKDRLNKLKLQLRWDMNKFFTQYFAYKYFPVKTLKRRERKKKFDIEQMAKNLPNNNSIWVYDNESLSKLESLKINFDVITNAHFSANEKNHFINFTFPKKLRQIRTITLKNIQFYVSSKQFDDLLRLNEQIRTIIIADCTFSTITINIFLGCMRKLNFLSKLSITSNKLFPVQIDPQQLFILTNLTHLNIDNYKFKKIDPAPTSAHLKGLQKLTKLQYLGLYGCQVYSDILGYLYKNFPHLIFLNLGRTQIDNRACQYLKKMISLKYLNINESKIQGEAFVDMSQSLKRECMLDCPLKYLSFENQKVKSQKKLSIQNLKDLAAYLPRLAYLNIAYNQNILAYNFGEFKNLKSVALDKNQFEKLQNIISPQITPIKVTPGGEQ